MYRLMTVIHGNIVYFAGFDSKYGDPLFLDIEHSKVYSSEGINRIIDIINTIYKRESCDHLYMINVERD